jgi:hypothetical protein
MMILWTSTSLIEEKDDYNEIEEEIVLKHHNPDRPTYNNKLEAFKTKSKISFMHLNINSLHSKINEIDKILKLKKFDIVPLNETKLDKNKPTSFYQNSDYDIIRRT